MRAPLLAAAMDRAIELAHDERLCHRTSAGRAEAGARAPPGGHQARGFLEMDPRGPAQTDTGVRETEIVMGASVAGCFGDGLQQHPDGRQVFTIGHQRKNGNILARPGFGAESVFIAARSCRTSVDGSPAAFGRG